VRNREHREHARNRLVLGLLPGGARPSRAIALRHLCSGSRPRRQRCHAAEEEARSDE
jgi:hypothetical protein